MSSSKLPTPSRLSPGNIHLGSQVFEPKPSNLANPSRKDEPPIRVIDSLQDAIRRGVFNKTE